MNSATRIGLLLVSLWLLWLPYRCALALNPALDVSQYAHTAWRIREGFASGEVSKIAQTADGFLWLGTDNGLVRFDGVRISPWQPPTGSALPDNRISALLGARDGTLWIGTARGLVSWSHGRLSTYPEFSGRFIPAIFEDREGAIWLSSALPPEKGLLCSIRRGDTKCYGSDGAFGVGVAAGCEDRDGKVWVAAANGLWRWRPGPPQRYSLPESFSGSHHPLTEAPAGGILAATQNGVQRVANGKVEPYWLAPARLQLNSILSDTDGALWIGAVNGGLLHLYGGRVDRFGHADGLTDDDVYQVFEDREASIWAVTRGGLDRFRPLAATTYSVAEGVTGLPGSVLADKDGSIWFSASEGLYRWQEGRIAVYRGHQETKSQAPIRESVPSAPVHQLLAAGLPENTLGSLYQDHRGRLWLGTVSGLGYLEPNRFVAIAGVPSGYIDSIVEDADGNLWIAHREAGLLELSFNRVVQRIPWTNIGQNGFAFRLAADTAGGGLWLGFSSGGIAHIVEGRVQDSYGAHDGLGKGPVNELRAASDGTVWVATDGGLSRIKAGHIATLDSKVGLPCNHIDSSIEDEGSLWLYAACGLVHIAASEVQAWNAEADEARSKERKVRIEVFNDSDGIPSFSQAPSFRPHIAKTTDGRLWFVVRNGLAVLDPHHLPFNKLSPPVHVEKVIADRTAYDVSSPLHLPPLQRDLEIEYTALSLVAPEKVRFRYELEGRDSKWQDVGNRRSAFYTDLPPGNYRFRVVAANNSGVWNEYGASLSFSVAPAYWQTNWFRALCVTAFLGLLWTLYQLRLRQVTQAFQRTLEARVSERTRIARELHDTLLQSLQGLLLRFRTVQTLIPTRPNEAQHMLESAIDEARAAVTEGRSAVQGLRTSTFAASDFTEAIRALGEALASDPAYSSCVALNLNIEGTPRVLQPLVRDEIYRTASEALRNAYRHADASRIEVQLDYGERRFELRVRDDGKGIDSKVLGDEAVPGHFGLSGMRERTKEIGGRLTIWSAPGSGTEVELSIPGSVAYAISSRAPRSWFAGRFFQGRTAQKS